MRLQNQGLCSNPSVQVSVWVPGTQAAPSACQALTYLRVPHHQLGLGVLGFEVQELLQGCGLDPGHTLPFKTQLLLRSIFQPLENAVFLLCYLLPPKAITIALALSPQWDQVFY